MSIVVLYDKSYDVTLIQSRNAIPYGVYTGERKNMTAADLLLLRVISIRLTSLNGL